MPDESGWAEARRWLVPIVAVVVVLGGIWLVGRLDQGPSRAPGTDVAGPSSGESETHYLGRARASLTGASGTRWALASLRAGMSVDDAWRLVGPAQLSQVSLQVSVPKVQTPATLVPARSHAQLAAAPANAATEIERAAQTSTAGTQRSDQVDRLVVARLRGGCACVVALVVRADAAVLRDLAAQPQVRAVQALPADARGGRFAIITLLPEQTGMIGPLDDTGPVPVA